MPHSKIGLPFMPAASAVFSEIWAKDDAGHSAIEALIARAGNTSAAEEGRVGWLIHRDLKAANHVLSYELFRDKEWQPARPAGTDTSVACEIAPLSAPQRYTSTPDGPVAIFVYCRVENMGEFAPSITLHIETTLANEPGCLAFAWHRDTASANLVVLYELYASRDALAEHRRSPHLAAFRQRSEHMMLDARIHYAALVQDASLQGVVTFFGGNT